MAESKPKRTYSDADKADISKRRAAQLARGFLVAMGRLPPGHFAVADEEDAKALEEGDYAKFSGKTVNKWAQREEQAAIEAIELLKSYKARNILASDGYPMVDMEVIRKGFETDDNENTGVQRLADATEATFQDVTGIDLERTIPAVAGGVSDMIAFAQLLAPYL